MTRVVIVGGYGAFGSRIAERLARDAGLALTIAGRNLDSAEALAMTLARTGAAGVEATVLDARSSTAEDLARLGARIVINASGPFQEQDYTLARAAIAAGCHYIDLADARAFVAGISGWTRRRGRRVSWSCPAQVRSRPCQRRWSIRFATASLSWKASGSGSRLATATIQDRRRPRRCSRWLVRPCRWRSTACRRSSEAGPDCIAIASPASAHGS